MAVHLSTLALRHPVLSCALLLLLAFPIFHLFIYFFPLFISTALCVAALVTAGAPAAALSEASSRDAENSKSSSWLGQLHECVRLWLERKLRIRRSLQSEPGDCPEDNTCVETEHEKRVNQLERTLRTLSFVSYEGIFATDGTLIPLDDDDEDARNSAPQAIETSGRPEDGPAQPQPEAPSEAPEPAPDAPDSEDDGSSESAEQLENMSDTSSSWQEVDDHNESDPAQQSPA